MIGLPFAPTRDPRIKLKKEFKAILKMYVSVSLFLRIITLDNLLTILFIIVLDLEFGDFEPFFREKILRRYRPTIGQ
ncbi:unnamed protein product [Anisakis simplex]|uniref:Uncharacterized protein n=1 Tax=Anisakis simplex TaxID=6269 RepID=A0A0M3JIS0_ANISI|nr:unnamed protein product [Anisakis simplex]